MHGANLDRVLSISDTTPSLAPLQRHYARMTTYKKSKPRSELRSIAPESKIEADDECVCGCARRCQCGGRSGNGSVSEADGKGGGTAL
jgi:hypothetical protein